MTLMFKLSFFDPKSLDQYIKLVITANFLSDPPVQVSGQRFRISLQGTILVKLEVMALVYINLKTIIKVSKFWHNLDCVLFNSLQIRLMNINLK